ncbi:DUF1572 family protein [Chitinophaga qingshengii]|uniref:DUF1572 family protein n=1 Tax=Chitinophaga qingshengii TaxID=1569794 RepID=A0ABR7THJ0_9BACT|nr:DUF1572 family protein [Chitinophaga qingshengii]MBC9929961.1 DUF1572 family protein [Chitinophaga qingshengii]
MQLYLDSALQRFRSYYDMGTKTIERLDTTQLHWQPQGEPNSVAMIVKHLRGNMLSRWTDFLTSDGEKRDRHRDEEFEEDQASKEVVLQRWHEGWACLLNAIGSLTPADLEKTVYIRAEAHSVLDAINRQMTHIPYHVGQMVYLGKMIMGDHWQSLSIPKGQSEIFNRAKFGN